MKRSLLFFFVIAAFTSTCFAQAKSSPAFSWKQLSDTVNYRVAYIYWDEGTYADKGTLGKDILDFATESKSKKTELTGKQQLKLVKLVTTTINFSGTPCAAFDLNSGFIIYKGASVVGKINVGCAYNQWNFTPANALAKQGAFGKKGIKLMKSFVDGITIGK